MYVLLKNISAKNIIENIDEKFKSNNIEIIENIDEKIKSNNKKLLKEIDHLKTENYQFKKQNIYLNTILEDIHNHLGIDKKICPICNQQSIAFLPFGENPRKNALCPHCTSLERDRATYLFLKNNTNIFKNNIKMLHIAPEKALADVFLGQKNIDYLPVDLDVNKPYVKEKMDIQDIEYPDNTFDFIYCSHVLEHVPDDKKAMEELYRVLKHKGEALIIVPINHSFKETFEDPSINTPELRSKYYGQFDHLRCYGLDFPDKLRNTGFNVISDDIDFSSEMDNKTLNIYRIDEPIDSFYCTK